MDLNKPPFEKFCSYRHKLITQINKSKYAVRNLFFGKDYKILDANSETALIILK